MIKVFKGIDNREKMFKLQYFEYQFVVVKKT